MKSSSCTWRSERVLQDYYLPGNSWEVQAGPAPNRDHALYNIFCDDTLVGTRWFAPAQPAGPSAQDLAERAVKDIPMPVSGIAVNPRSRGITGKEAWFWAEGYDGGVVTDGLNELGVSVTLEARPTRYTWHFGDGTTVDADLGRPYPQRSSVVHTYTATGTHTVRLEIEFAARYWVDGVGPVELPPVVRSAERTYQVIEAQAVRTR